MHATGTKTALLLIALLAGAALALPAPAGAYDDWNRQFIGFPSSSERSFRADCRSGRPACIDRTIGEMWRRFHRVIPGCEHNNVFSLTYLRVTEAIAAADDEGFYPDSEWLQYQDAIFARVYFLTYDNWVRGRRHLVPESWRVAFDAGRERSVQGLGNLLLSMNAHVNRDFPFILYHAGLTSPDGSSRKPEHDSGNVVLRRLYRPMLDELANRFDESINDYDVPGVTVDDESFFRVLVQWREAAWDNAVRLAEARNDAERRAVARDIEGYANGWAGLIRAGAGYVPGVHDPQREARERRCARFGGQRPAWRRGADVARPGPRAALDDGRLRVRMDCPDGIGPCAGKVRVRRPWRVGKRFPWLAERRFLVRPGASRRLILHVGPRGAAELRRAQGRRGVWIAALSKQGPGEAKTRRRKARLRL